MRRMTDNSELIEKQRCVVQELQDAVIESPAFQPEKFGSAIEAQVNALRKLEDPDA